MDTRKSPSAITFPTKRFRLKAGSRLVLNKGRERCDFQWLGKCFRLSYTMKKMKSGFTLMEIMIVLAIVIALLTIAVPGLLRSRVITNETVALTNCRAINNACQLYHINQESYPNSLSDLAMPVSNPPYIDTTLATGRKQGYEFVYKLVDADHFTLNANPVSSGLLKGRYFYTDESGIIRAKSDGPAGPTDEIIL